MATARTHRTGRADMQEGVGLEVASRIRTPRRGLASRVLTTGKAPGRGTKVSISASR